MGNKEKKGIILRPLQPAVISNNIGMGWDGMNDRTDTTKRY